MRGKMARARAPRRAAQSGLSSFRHQTASPVYFGRTKLPAAGRPDKHAHFVRADERCANGPTVAAAPDPVVLSDPERRRQPQAAAAALEVPAEGAVEKFASVLGGALL
jgi:hypothetical protein